MDRDITHKLSVFYALYFALLGCIAPYWGLFLQDRKFNPEQIGILMGCFGLMRIIAPNLWAYWGRYFASPLHMIRAAAIMTLLCFSLIAFADTLLSMAVVMMLYGFFWAAMLPQYELMTMRQCENKVELYSRIRMWGSIGFILTVAAAGLLFEWLSVAVLPLIMFVMMVVITVNSFRMPTSAAVKTVDQEAERQPFLPVLLSKPIMLFLGMVILLNISHGPYYTFFSIYLESKGYTSTVIGMLWALGVVAEVALFWQFQRLVHFLSWQHWCMLALIFTALRWLLVAVAADIGWILVISQAGHAFSFAVMHAVSMRYVQHLFPPALQARGQAVYASAGFGLGGAIGALASGLMWDSVGGEWVFGLASATALAAMLVAWRGLPCQDAESRQTA